MRTRYRLFFVILILAAILNNIPAVHSQINVGTAIHLPGVNVGTNIPVPVPGTSKPQKTPPSPPESQLVADLRASIAIKNQALADLHAQVADRDKTIADLNSQILELQSQLRALGH